MRPIRVVSIRTTKGSGLRNSGAALYRQEVHSLKIRVCSGRTPNIYRLLLCGLGAIHGARQVEQTCQLMSAIRMWRQGYLVSEAQMHSKGDAPFRSLGVRVVPSLYFLT